MSSLVVNLNDNDFDAEVQKAKVPMLVDFWAPTCGPCKAVAPLLEELAGEYAGRLIVAKVNVNDNMGLAAKFRIRAIPYFVMLKGGQEVATMMGARSKAEFKATIEEHIK